jgi:alpha-glucosidase
MRALTDRYGARMMVGEVGENRRAVELMSEYTAGNDRLHMAYSFDMLGPEFSARHFRSRIEGFFKGAPDGWPCWSFSNHDVIRHVSRWKPFARDLDALATQAAAMLLSFEGSICLYQGEELGQTETEMEFHELTDPPGITFWPEYKGRDGCRTPMVWQAQAEHGGFSDVKPWLPVKAEQAARSVSAQAADHASVMAFYRAMIAWRQATPALISGRTHFADLPEPILAFSRGEGAQRVLAVFNLSAHPQSVRIAPGPTLSSLSRDADVGEGALDLAANGFAFFEGFGTDVLG